jgi:hypothetical protein
MSPTSPIITFRIIRIRTSPEVRYSFRIPDSGLGKSDKGK